MEMSVEEHASYIILKPLGRIDHATCSQFDEVIKPYVEMCKQGGKNLVFDFSLVNYISSVGLRVLMMAAKQVKMQQGRIVICELTPVVAEIFAVGRFNLIYDVFNSVAFALKALETPPKIAG
jgi:anti-anti-sigma factor